MVTILTAHQPLYIPYCGFFQKVSMADVFCLWDDVQYTQDSYINKNSIKNGNGQLLLTVPIHTENFMDKTIKDMTIDNTHGWRKNHWSSITVSYGANAPYFESYKDFFEDVYRRDWEKIVDLDEHILRYLLKELKINAEFLKASDLHFEGKKNDRILDMCLKLNADLLIFGQTGETYADTAMFEAKGVKLHFQKYKHPRYPQLYGQFIPNLSIIDLLFCFGEKSYDILTKNNLTKQDLIKKYLA